MQKEVSNRIQLGQDLNPLNDVSAVRSIDNQANVKDLLSKVDKLGELWDEGKADESVARYLPGLTNVSRQGKLYNIIGRRTYTSSTYTNKKTLEFTIQLAANTFSNFSMMCVVLPVQIKKSISKATDIDNDLVTVNGFFFRWLKEIGIRSYPDYVRILSNNTNNAVSIADYAANQLKHLPGKSLADIRDTILYNKNSVVLTGSKDRRSNISTDIKDRQDANLVWRLSNLKGDLKEQNYFRIPSGWLLSLGLVNFAYQLDTRFIFTLETNLDRLFESNAKGNIPDAPDAQIIFHDTPYISYPEITLTDNFLVYANGILRGRGALRTSVWLNPYQQSFEVNKGIQSIKIDSKG